LRRKTVQRPLPSVDRGERARKEIAGDVRSFAGTQQEVTMSRFKLWITGGTLASLLGLMVLAAATPARAHGVVGDPKGAGQRTGVVQATLQLRPTSGPAGTSIQVRVSQLKYFCPTFLDFVDANGVETTLEVLPPSLSFKTRSAIPSDAPAGIGTVLIKQGFPHDKFCDILHFPVIEARASFTVTPQHRQSA
jgi:hypothetical protein